MFKKKSSLLKKVWRLKLGTLLSEPDVALLHNVLKNMDEQQLSTLLKSVSTAGGCETACIGPSAKCRKVQVPDQKYVLLKAFVYVDLRSITQLKHLHGCKASAEQKICLNPYHSSLIIDSEMPPPPYSIMDETSLPLRATSISSLTDSTTPSFLEDMSSSEESEPLDSGIDDSSHSPPIGHSPPMHHQLPQEDSDSIGCTNLLFDGCSMDSVCPHPPPQQHAHPPLSNNNRPPPPAARSNLRTTDNRSSDLRTTERPNNFPQQRDPSNDPHQSAFTDPLLNTTSSPDSSPVNRDSSPDDASPENRNSDRRDDESSESSGSHYKQIIDASSSLSGASSSHSSSNVALIPTQHPENESTDQQQHPNSTNHRQQQRHTNTTCGQQQQQQTTSNQSCPLHGCGGRPPPNNTSSRNNVIMPPSSPYTTAQPTFRGPWCKMVYWEQKARVGPFYEAQDQNCVNVFEDLPQGTGFCLALLGASEELSISKRIRTKIRYGLQLTREPDGVWLYNRSNHVLFTWSPSLQLEATGEQTAGTQTERQMGQHGQQQTPPQVKRVPVGCSIKVFDQTQVQQLSRAKLIDTTTRLPSNTPTFKRFNIRVSFAKGWGQGYRRTFITQCPCWIECFLNDQMVK